MKHDTKCIKSLQIANVCRDGGDKFRICKCSQFPDYATDVNIDYIYAILKTVNNDGYKKITTAKSKNNAVIVNINSSVFRKQTAYDWITNNKPLPKERTTTYYDRYKNANDNYLIPKDFGPLVADVLKRSSVRGTDGRHW